MPHAAPASSQGPVVVHTVLCRAVPCCAVGGTKVKINLSGSLSSALLLPWPPLGWARREHTARHGRGGRLPPAAFIVISANMCTVYGPRTGVDV